MASYSVIIGESLVVLAIGPDNRTTKKEAISEYAKALKDPKKYMETNLDFYIDEEE